jgi:hypothetical protein
VRSRCDSACYDDVQDGDNDFLSRVVEEAERERASIIAAAAAELDSAAQQLEFNLVVPMLRKAVDALDERLLREYLQRARGINLDQHSLASVRGLVQAAADGLDRLEACKLSLERAVASVSPQLLVDAVAVATGLGYHTAIVDQARTLLVQIQDIAERGNRAFETIDTDAMAEVLRQCKELRLQLPFLDEMRAILALTPDLLLRRKLAAAVASGSEQRVVDLTVQMKVRAHPAAVLRAPPCVSPAIVWANGVPQDDYFRDHPSEFQVLAFPNLKPVQVFSRKFGVAEPILQASMMSFQQEPLHTCLTVIRDKTLRRTAVHLFRGVLGIMGDRPCAQPGRVAKEVCVAHAGGVFDVLVRARVVRAMAPIRVFMRGGSLVRLCAAVRGVPCQRRAPR